MLTALLILPGLLATPPILERCSKNNASNQVWVMPLDGIPGKITSGNAKLEGTCLTFTAKGLRMNNCTHSNSQLQPSQLWVWHDSLGGSGSIQTEATHCDQGPRCCLNGPWHHPMQRLVGQTVNVSGCDCAGCKDQRFIYNNETMQLSSVESRLCITAH